MRLNRLGITAAALASTAIATTAGFAQDPPAAAAPSVQPPPVVYTVPPPPPAPAPPPPQATQSAPTPPSPYQRCSRAGRGQASTAPCALSVVNGQTPRLWIRIERNLPAPPAAVILIWREREGVGGVIHRIEGRALGNPGATQGTLFSVPVSRSYCAPNARPFEVEMELASGRNRNIGVIGRFSFPCTP